jgi:prepilin-type N-terminal cleavage/methylation domain-containing protein
MSPEPMTHEAGFTLIELILAMAVFAFMLLLIVVGFLNVVRLHDEVVAANQAQDSARSAMDTIVQAVRDSSAVVQPTTQGAPWPTLCVASSSGPDVAFYVDSTTNILYEANNCSAPYVNAVPLTSSNEQAYFQSKLESTSTNPQWRPEVELKLIVASNNGTTTGSGSTLACGPSNVDRAFCSVVTLTTGAEPR